MRLQRVQSMAHGTLLMHDPEAITAYPAVHHLTKPAAEVIATLAADLSR